jgi:hypothetical protein
MPELEPDLAEALLDDRSPEVRERLATHTQDPAVITALLADRTVRVRKGLALNPRTTAEQRHALAQDAAVDVRSALVSAADLDEADLRLLAKDRSAEVRRALAASTRTPAHIRQALEDDADEAVAAEARRVRQVPAARPARRGRTRFITGPAR